MTRATSPAQQPEQPALTWEWEGGRCYILVEGKVVADGETMGDALKVLGEQLRKAEKEAGCWGSDSATRIVPGEA